MWVNFVIIMSYNHQNGQTGPFMVWVNGKQYSVLLNFVPESLKNGHESLKLVSKMALKKLNTNFGPFHPENQEYLFRCSVYFLETFCESFGKQPGYLVGGGGEGVMVFCTLLWDVE